MFVVRLLARSGILCGILDMLKEGRVGNDGKFGISIFDMLKLLIWGMEKPSKLSKPVNGDCKASLGLSSDDELEPFDDDEGDDETDDDGLGDEADERSEDDDMGDAVSRRLVPMYLFSSTVSWLFADYKVTKGRDI